MSEFLAEARILVRPDTSRFRADLEAQLASAVRRPIQIPVVPIVSPGFAAAGAATSALVAAQQQAAASTAVTADALATATTISRQYAGAVDLSAVSVKTLAAVQVKQAAAATASAAATTEASAAAAAAARNQSGFARGVGSSALSLLGIRGATLAASGAFLGGAAAITLFAKSLRSAASLETELNVFAVNAGATADQMERVSAAAKQLGRDITLPGVTAQTAATAMTELAKAGLSVEDAMAGARGALQLATAAQIDTAQASELVANTLNAFGLAGTDAVKVADLLAGAAKSAQGEIGEFGTALGQVASVADQFGVSAEDTVTLLTQLAKAGLQGGRAGTTLRVAILGLIKPTAAAAVELKKLEKAGVEITKPNGAFDPTAFAQINTALQKYSKEQQNVVRNTIFSSDAIKVLGRATAGGVEDFNKINRAVGEAGISLETSSARTQGLTGDFQNLSNQVESLSTTVGQLASGPVSAIVTKLADMAKNANAAADNFVKLTSATGDLAGKMRDSIPIVGQYVEVLKKLAGAGFDPIGTTSSLLGDVVDKAKETAAGLKQAVASNAAGLRDVPGLKEFVDNLDEFVGAIEKSGPPTKKAMKDLVDAVKDGVNQIGDLQPPPVFNVKRLQNIIQGFDANQVRDKIAGDNSALVADLEAQQKFLIARLQSQGVQNRPALKRALESQLLGVVTDLRTIQAKAKSDQEQLKREREAATKQAIADAKEQAALLLQQAQAEEALRNSRLDLLIQAAGLTRGTDDDKRAIKKKISVLQQDINGLDAIKKKTLEQKQKIVDLKSAILSLRSSLASLSSAQNGGGFSLNDLFKEAVSNFETFGSNIAARNGVLSAQDARAQFSGNILAQLGSSQLTEAQRQTAYLASIDHKLSGTTTAGQRKGLLWERTATIEGLRGAAMAAYYGYGAG